MNLSLGTASESSPPPEIQRGAAPGVSHRVDHSPFAVVIVILLIVLFNTIASYYAANSTKGDKISGILNLIAARLTVSQIFSGD